MALGWTPESWRARGRPKATCRRTVVRERGKLGWKSWNLAKVAAPDRGVGWTMWQPYAPTGAASNDDDDDDDNDENESFNWIFFF